MYNMDVVGALVFVHRKRLIWRLVSNVNAIKTGERRNVAFNNVLDFQMISNYYDVVTMTEMLEIIPVDL